MFIIPLSIFIPGATDIVEDILAVKNLIGVLQTAATYISDSCKRMNVWTEVHKNQCTGTTKLMKLQKIGDSRWWSKQAALKNILGTFDNPQTEYFCLLLEVLSVIKSSSLFEAKTTFEASVLLEKWTRFDALLTAFLMLRVYSILHQTSEHLQTSGLDYLSAWNMVEDAKQQIAIVIFEDIHKKTLDFIAKCNEIVAGSNNNDFTVDIESDFRSERVKLTKRMSGEREKDSRPTDSITRFRVGVYRTVIDQITSSMNERFTVNQAIILDTACLDPRRFKEINDSGIPSGGLYKIAELTGLDATSLHSELSSFARTYELLCRRNLALQAPLFSHFSLIQNLKMNHSL